jgi:hypothetical protein
LTNDAAAVEKLLAGGANPNSDRFFGFTALQIAVIHSNNAMALRLLADGADVAAADANGNTALMWAAAAEPPNPVLLGELLKRGADPAAKNKMDETAIHWAIRRGNMDAVARLQAAGASHAAAVRSASEKAIAALQKSGQQFVKVSGCASCHHQSLPQMLNGAARKRGFHVDPSVAAQQVKSVMAMFRPIREKLLDGSATLPNPAISVSYSLLGLDAEGYAADETTAAMAAAILRTQLSDGSFAVLPARPPLEASRVSGTALGVRALQLYGKDVEENIARARDWLVNAKPYSGEDRSMRLLGLVWAGAPQPIVDSAVAELMSAQRPDGGWAQLPGLESDAYATGQALVALQNASRTAPASAIAYLLRTQLPDGSWHVRTRSNPLQPLKDSGFPHGRDQWISAAGTSWAAMALVLSQPVPSSGTASEGQ